MPPAGGLTEVRRARAVAVIVAAFLAVPAGGRATEAVARGRLAPEVAVADPLVVPARNEETMPEVAGGDGGFLAVWEDDRHCCSHTIYGTRLDEAGAALDLFGIRISTRDIPSDYDPAVAWNGSEYVVAWESSQAVEVTRVTVGGEVEDSPPLSVGGEDGLASAPDVASTGDGTLIVWRGCVYAGSSCDYGVYGAVLDRDGRLSGPLLLAGGVAEYARPSVAAGRDGYLVTWAIPDGDDRGLYALRVGPNGETSGTPSFVLPGNYADADVAFGADHFMAVWGTDEDEGFDVWGVRLDRDGAPLDPRPVVIAFGRPMQFVPQVSPDEGGGYYVVWQERLRTSGIFGTRITAAGEVVRTNGTRAARMEGGEWDPAVAFDGTVRVVVWRSRQRSRVDVYGVARRPADALPGEARPLATGLNVQSASAAAWNGRVFLVVWEDSRETSWPYDVYAARVTPSGRVLDGAGFKVSSTRTIVFEPSVASDGRDFFVVWEDWRNYDRNGEWTNLYGARVLGDGTVAETGIPISTVRGHQRSVGLVWAGSSYLAAWEDFRDVEDQDAPEGADIYATAVTRAGRVVSPQGRRVAAGPRHQGTPTLTSSDGEALLAWTEGCAAWRDEECKRDVFARRLSPQAESLGRGIPVATRRASESYPAVMAGPSGYHAVWTRSKDGRLALIGKTLSAGARPRVLHRFDREVWGASLDWTGRYGLLSWTEGETPLDGDEYELEVYALRLSADGRPLDSAPITVAAGPDPELHSDVVAGPRGCAAIVFRRHFQSADTGVRSFLRLAGGCS